MAEQPNLYTQLTNSISGTVSDGGFILKSVASHFYNEVMDSIPLEKFSIEDLNKIHQIYTDLQNSIDKLMEKSIEIANHSLENPTSK